ncbi:MAG TPA: hypothetical protein VL308_02085 [Gemmatimonadaceae bacterium]|jgi:hypothetical protein|nr:hypothetical protein [Gemmatimonadaceae bacterium]
MWRFVAVLGLALIGIVLFLGFADLIQRCALVAAFGAAAMLPAVMNPTRHWARGFFRCFDLVYAAACVGAYFGAIVVYPASRIEIFTAGLIPGLLFGTMASLGVGRSWLADVGSSRRS